jgi:hypothetical protein
VPPSSRRRKRTLEGRIEGRTEPRRVRHERQGPLRQAKAEALVRSFDPRHSAPAGSLGGPPCRGRRDASWRRSVPRPNGSTSWRVPSASWGANASARSSSPNHGSRRSTEYSWARDAAIEPWRADHARGPERQPSPARCRALWIRRPVPTGLRGSWHRVNRRSAHPLSTAPDFARCHGARLQEVGRRPITSSSTTEVGLRCAERRILEAFDAGDLRPPRSPLPRVTSWRRHRAVAPLRGEPVEGAS